MWGVGCGVRCGVCVSLRGVAASIQLPDQSHAAFLFAEVVVVPRFCPAAMLSCAEPQSSIVVVD